MSFRFIRILFLLGLLLLVAGMSYWERLAVTQWLRPLEVVVYPVAGDDSEAVRAYLDQLDVARFAEIGNFIQTQSERYAGSRMPLAPIRLGPEIGEIPPTPQDAGQGPMQSLLWSLKLRHYVLRHTPFFDGLGQIKLFVVYHRGEEGVPLQHSLGLQKGLLGVVHVFAQENQSAQNNVVIAHELFHTLGASDKYDRQGVPLYPEGFGEPGDEPSYPQRKAEIMAGRVAIAPDRTKIPENLDACVVGYKTAYEINW